jgi:hypothetical protein
MQGVKSQKDAAFSDTALTQASSRGKFSYGRYGGGVVVLLHVGALM